MSSVSKSLYTYKVKFSFIGNMMLEIEREQILFNNYLTNYKRFKLRCRYQI